MNSQPYCSFCLTVIGAAWFLIALFIGETELLSVLPSATIPATVWSLVAVLLVAYWRIQPFRAFIEEVDTRVLIGLHLARFVGFYFLYLSARGQLPARFAIPAGWGDIVVAVGALTLLFFPAPRLLLLWNAVGLIDILFVVFSAARQLFTNRALMTPFTELPLSFLPTLVVPLIIASHCILFLRLRRTSMNPMAIRL
jgi:hypothetical protein